MKMIFTVVWIYCTMRIIERNELYLRKGGAFSKLSNKVMILISMSPLSIPMFVLSQINDNIK